MGRQWGKTPGALTRGLCARQRHGACAARLGLAEIDDVLVHPVVGGSWEGWVLDNLLAVLPEGTQAFFYSSSAGAEVGLVLELPREQRWAIEIKRSSAPAVSRGFHTASDDIRVSSRFVVYAGVNAYPLSADVEAISLAQLQQRLMDLGSAPPASARRAG